AKGRNLSAFPEGEHVTALEAGEKNMGTELKEIRKLSRRYSRLETLMNRVNRSSLIEEHGRQQKGKAVGVDGMTKEKYGERLEENIGDLLERMKSFSYRPQPVRRTYIPKANGKMRPLGIPSYEDKLVQGVMARILNEVYEPRFLDCSYGFREGRSAHDAIRDVNQTIMTRKVNYILDCDIKGFFDNVDHKWLMKFLEHDIADRNFLRYVARFLKAGVMEAGTYSESSVGTPQGGLISPVLANVYLHYVLDLWFERAVKPKLGGEAYLVRFADDFIVMFQYREEAERVYTALGERLKKFGLEVEQDKTHILPFGRWKGTKETFDFLGFTHYNGITRTGKYTVGHRIAKKKRKAFKANLLQWVKDNRHLSLELFLTTLNLKMTGAFRYYGISGTFMEICRLHKFGMWTAFKWLNRRSQRKSFPFDKFVEVWKTYVQRPRVYKDIWLWNLKGI
ncbi:MAG: group II intron reverse transcriptase/maturase, partial [Spirochaetales bacterium]|nr:group II intron reverse transcriptase/maturase [Candidatus Physcosoma equi]